jgi:hypothetical protein
MTAKTRDQAIEFVANPLPGSKLAAAKEFGVDLTLLVENLELTTTQRIEKLCSVTSLLEEVRQPDSQKP